MNVLNTRPEKQSHELTKLIEAIGGTVFQLPIIDIMPITFHPVFSDDYDIFIFTSRNAVTHFFAKQQSSSFSKAVLIAVGSATQNALVQLGLTQTICPTLFSSEGLLALPILITCNSKKIAVITGENPKSLLIDTLTARGATVSLITTYRRTPHRYDMKITFAALQKAHIDHIVVTSGESLSHLLALFFQREHHAWLIQKTLCVITSAMQNTAKTAGFRTILVADDPTDAAIVRALQKQK